MRGYGWALVALMMTAVLAGCSDSGSSDAGNEELGLDEGKVTDTTGLIRGTVVDGAVKPIKDALIEVTSSGQVVATTKTNEQGAFLVDDLEAGVYTVFASHPLYDRVQNTLSVVAGVADPPLVKFQLTRLISQDPYYRTEAYDGYITCSLNIIILLSEECGEGVGLPEDSCGLDLPPPCVDNPQGGGRVGGNANNRAQIDFYVDGPSIQTLVIEQVWEPSITSPVPEGQPGSNSGNLYTIINTEFSCDPVCDGNRLGSMEGGSGMLWRGDADVLGPFNLTADTVISTFTWATPEDTGAIVEQPYQLFVSHFYYLPAPENWSFVGGDRDPFL